MLVQVVLNPVTKIVLVYNLLSTKRVSGSKAVSSLEEEGGPPRVSHFGVTPFGYFIWSASFIWTENALNFRRRPFFRFSPTFRHNFHKG